MDGRPTAPLPGQLAFGFLDGRPAPDRRHEVDRREPAPPDRPGPSPAGGLFGDLDQGDGPYGSGCRRG